MDIASAIDQPLSFTDKLNVHLVAAAEDWAHWIDDLRDWENKNLLIENPSQEKLAKHRTAIERLMNVGRMLVFVTSAPEFTDDSSRRMVEASQRILRERLLMFHNPMTEEEADRVLTEAFSES